MSGDKFVIDDWVVRPKGAGIGVKDAVSFRSLDEHYPFLSKKKEFSNFLGIAVSPLFSPTFFSAEDFQASEKIILLDRHVSHKISSPRAPQVLLGFAQKLLQKIPK